MAETRYGFISDVHENPEILPSIVAALGKKKVDAVILNGDLGEDMPTIAQTMDAALTLGVPVYVQPGSHESTVDYFGALNVVKDSLLTDTVLGDRKFDFADHSLAFLPGSDSAIGGAEFFMGNYAGDGGVRNNRFSLISINPLSKLESMITQPERTIVVCHVPARFENPKTSVDYAYFAEERGGALVDGTRFEEHIRKKLAEDGNNRLSYKAIEAEAKKAGFTFMRANRGNVDLKTVYDHLGVTKAVSGHFHDASHRANDLASKPVAEGRMVDELFYNSGIADRGFAGVLVVNDTKARYHNIKVKV
ncbi:MAG: metallophosphoesterase family protein [Candidatus Pacearchaeota archaeon]